MLKSKLYRRLLIAGIAGSLLITSGVVAFASTTNAGNSTKSVIAGKAADSYKKRDRGDFQKSGIARVNPLVTVLKTEVTAGVITQTESDAITLYLTNKEASDKVTRTAEKAKFDAMTDAEKKAYMEANKPARTDLLAELVTAKLLTQTQADSIKAVMPQRPEGGKGHGMEMGNPLTTLLKTEVKAGVITQVESDKATAYLKTKADAERVKKNAEKAKYDAMTAAEKTADQAAKKVARDAEKAKVAAMTDAEKKAYFEANRPVKVNILTELVTAGIFTQAQADTIKAAMPQRPEMGKERGKMNGSRPIKGAKTDGTSSTISE